MIFVLFHQCKCLNVFRALRLCLCLFVYTCISYSSYTFNVHFSTLLWRNKCIMKIILMTVDGCYYH